MIARRYYKTICWGFACQKWHTVNLGQGLAPRPHSALWWHDRRPQRCPRKVNSGRFGHGCETLSKALARHLPSAMEAMAAGAAHALQAIRCTRCLRTSRLVCAATGGWPRQLQQRPCKHATAGASARRLRIDAVAQCNRGWVMPGGVQG